MTSNEFDSEYRVEPFSEENFPSLKNLFKSAFGADVSFEAYKHKYTTDAIGGTAINYIAIANCSDGRLVEFLKKIINCTVLLKTTLLSSMAMG